MCDCAIFLCCLNMYKIYCLEYTCLIISILIFPSNILGIIYIEWRVIKFLIELFYSINVAICFFNIFTIILIIYSTKIGKITTNEFYKTFSIISMLSLIVSIYLTITYSSSSYLIFKNYLSFHKNTNNEKYSKFELKELVRIFNSKKTWIILFISTILPSILSLISILFWISIYYRISYRIYCSFNKEIRKELREQKKKNKQFRELEENNSKNNNETNKDKDKDIKNKNNFVSVVIEKDRHPGPRIISSGGIYTNNNIDKSKIQIQMKNLPNFNKGGEYKDSDIVSSERIFEKSNNPISK